MPLRGCFRLQQGDRSGYWSRDASECVELADRKPLANAAGRHRAVRLLKRVEELHARGETDAYLYGAQPSGEYGALNAFFLLKDEPFVYNLPERPRRPAAHLKKNYLFSFAATIALTAISAVLFSGGDRG